jgi:hypothetical protein
VQHSFSHVNSMNRRAVDRFASLNGATPLKFGMVQTVPLAGAADDSLKVP